MFQLCKSSGIEFAIVPNMKKCICVTCLLASFFSMSCTPKSDKTASTENNSKRITTRNIYINKENSYSDFFFDSSKLASYITEQKLPDSLSNRITSFYNARNYQYAWFSSTGVTEQGRGFWNMYRYYTTYEPTKVLPDTVFIKKMDKLVSSTDSNWQEKQNGLLLAEMKMSEHFLRFFLTNIDQAYLKRKEIERFIPYYKRDAISQADSLVNKKHKNEKYYEDVNPAYAGLKLFLAKYVAIYKNGGWPVIMVKAAALKPGSNDPSVGILKKRLWLSADLSEPDSGNSWNEPLTLGVKNFQLCHGYKPTGILTDVQLKDMNVKVQDRIIQLLINMGRTQWMIDQPKGKFILVNLPEFLLHVTENDKKIFDMEVVVGKEGHNTTIFAGNLNEVVFAPYWNVPESIVEKEILPALARNKNYLAKNNMERNGVRSNGSPIIRQLPGPKNSLGQVKFLFPNSYDIYFHDTPAKSLFSKEKRAYSHGCIRLSEPAKLAAWLLQQDTQWDTANINKAMHSSEEKTVRLKEPVPVLITYYTAWVTENGMLRFADDIYGHDLEQRKKMFN